MKPIRDISIALVLTVLASGSFAGGQVECGLDDIIPGTFTLRLLDGVDIDDFIALFEADHPDLDLNLQVEDAIESRPIYFLSFDETGLSEAQMDQLEG